MIYTARLFYCLLPSVLNHGGLFMKNRAIARLFFIGAWACMANAARAEASGAQPETSVLLVSEDQAVAQMALSNGGDIPLLLHTSVYDVDNDKGLILVPLPPITRIEAGARQIIRFVLETPAEPLTVQHYKRVTFEGIPPKAAGGAASHVRVNVRYDYPVIISPKGLVQHDSPWVLMQWRLQDTQLSVKNPSPFIVRLSSEIELLPVGKRVAMLKRTFILPGESVTIDLPVDTPVATLTAVRLSPATLYGFAAPDFDAPLIR